MLKWAGVFASLSLVFACSSGDEFTTGSGGANTGGSGNANTGGSGNASTGGSGNANTGGSGNASTGGAPTGGAPNGGAPNGGAPNGGAPSGGGGSSGGGGPGGGGAPSGGGGVAGSAGQPCSSGSTTCTGSEFCNAPGCGSGNCMPKVASPGTALNAVCGCDGLTYWNASQAAYHGMSAKSLGACSPSAGVVCDPIATPCAVGTYCSLELPNAAACGPTGVGVCWVLPQQGCAGQPTGGKDCANGCASKCSLIEQEMPWYPSGCG